MVFNRETLDYLSKMSKIRIDSDKEEEFISSLKSISEWIDKISEVNTDDVEPTLHMSFENNVLRDDVPYDCQKQAEILKNSPEKDSNYFRVPENTKVKKNIKFIDD